MYDAALIGKQEQDHPHGLRGKVLKICTLKVVPGARGSKLGELLLKTTFRFAHANAYDSIYFEAFRGHDDIITLAEEFGFEITEGRGPRAENWCSQSSSDRGLRYSKVESFQPSSTD